MRGQVAASRGRAGSAPGGGSSRRGRTRPPPAVEGGRRGRGRGRSSASPPRPRSPPRRTRTGPAARTGSRRCRSVESHPDDVVDQAAEQAASGAGHVQVGPAPDQPAGVDEQRLQLQRLRRRTARARRAGRGGTPGCRCRRRVTRLPRFSPSTVLEYQLVISSRRPSMSSVSLASAEVVMPCGHHRSVASSPAFHRNPWSTAVPGTRAFSAFRLRWASTPAMPTRRPNRSAASSMSATFSSVRRRWMLDDGSGLTGPT